MPIILLVHRYLFYLEKIALQNGINELSFPIFKNPQNLPKMTCQENVKGAKKLVIINDKEILRLIKERFSDKNQSISFYGKIPKMEQGCKVLNIHIYKRSNPENILFELFDFLREKNLTIKNRDYKPEDYEFPFLIAEITEEIQNIFNVKAKKIRRRRPKKNRGIRKNKPTLITTF